MNWERTAFVVRESRGHWIREMVAAVHAVDLRAILVTTALDEAEQADLASFVDDFLVVPDVYDADVIAEALLRLTGGVVPAGVVTAAEGVVVSTARTAELIGKPRCSSAALTVTRNKFAVREVLAAAGQPNPAYALISDPAQAADVAARVGLPAIIKPVNGAASNLVRLVSTVEELADACVLLAKRLPESTDVRYHRPVTGLPGTDPLDPARSFLVEGVLHGREYSLDVAIRDGVVYPAEVVDKPLVDEHSKFELGMCCPPLDFPADRARRIEQVVGDAVLALGLDDTMAHVEVIDDATLGPTIVEVNAGRPAGAAQSVMIKLGAGIDIYAEMVAAALDLPRPERTDALPIPVGYLMFFSGSGRLVRVHGLDEVAEIPEVIEVMSIVSPGDELTDEQQIYAVNVFLAGFTDHEDLAAIRDEAAKLIRFELEDVS